MTIRLTTLMLTVGIALAVLFASAPRADASRDCGTYRGKGGPYRVIVVDGPVRCRTARQVLRRYATSHAPCEGSGCYRTTRGWTCGTSNAIAFPRLFSCSRGKRTVAAFSIAD